LHAEFKTLFMLEACAQTSVVPNMGPEELSGLFLTGKVHLNQPNRWFWNVPLPERCAYQLPEERKRFTVLGQPFVVFVLSIACETPAMS